MVIEYSSLQTNGMQHTCDCEMQNRNTTVVCNPFTCV
jgi:hypothetical protein